MWMISNAARKALVPVLAMAVFAGPAVPLEAQEFSSGRITVSVSGNGPDVLLIPGLDSSGEVWADMVARLDGYRYHTVEVAGFAGAEAGANVDGPVLAPVAAEISRYIDEMEIEDPAVVGHSMGGLAALVVATWHPGDVARIVVVDSPAFVGAVMGPPGATADTIAPMAQSMRDAALAAGPEARKQQVLEQASAWVFDEDARQMLIDDALASDPAVSAQAMYDVMTTDLRDGLAQITVPVLVAFVTPAGMPMSEADITAFYQAQYAGVTDLTLEHIAESGHFVMLDRPARLARIIDGFFG